MGKLHQTAYDIGEHFYFFCYILGRILKSHHKVKVNACCFDFIMAAFSICNQIYAINVDVQELFITKRIIRIIRQCFHVFLESLYIFSKEYIYIYECVCLSVSVSV